MTTNRVQLAETPPEGFDNQRWFQLRETLRRFDLAINASTSQIEDLQTDRQLARPQPLVAYGLGARTNLAAGPVAGFASAPWGAGGIVGYVEAETVSFPTAQQTLTTAARVGQLRNDVFGSVLFAGSAAPTGIAGLVYVGLIAVPASFSDWSTEALKAYVAVSVTGLDALATVTLSWVIADPVVGNPAVVKTLGPFSEVAGTVTIPYGSVDSEAIFTADDMKALDFVPGTSLNFTMRMTVQASAQHTGGFFSLGRIEMNWR